MFGKIEIEVQIRIFVAMYLFTKFHVNVMN